MKVTQNNLITLINDYGYVSFIDEQEAYTNLVQARPVNSQWFATVTEYLTNRKFTYNFFDWSDGEMEVNFVNVGDVLIANHHRKGSNKYSYVYKCYYQIIAIDDDNVQLMKYPTIAAAIRAQRKEIKKLLSA